MSAFYMNKQNKFQIFNIHSGFFEENMRFTFFRSSIMQEYKQHQMYKPNYDGNITQEKINIKINNV